MSTVSDHRTPLNVSDRLSVVSREIPDALAVASPQRQANRGRRTYHQLTFGELEMDVDRLARGLVKLGVRPGMRLALLVPPSIEFISWVFALLRSGAVTVLIDPGMGRRNLVASLADAQPDGFVAISGAQAVRTLLRGRFRQARFNITVGRRWYWGGPTLADVRRAGEKYRGTLPCNRTDDPAAIIFTTGSTGPSKGVLYRHGNFDAQVTQIRDHYGIRPGEIDLPGFPLFGLFNATMGVSTVIPEMDASRPSRVDPRKIVAAIDDWHVTQAFGSPAMWNRVGRYCEVHEIELPSLRRVLSAGAPVPAHVLRRMKNCMHPDGEVYTPYGATEALPVASISASQVLGQTSIQTDQGAGVCVGCRFSNIDWKVIRPTEGPIASIAEVEELPRGEMGELIVRGPQVTGEYATRRHWNARSKIPADTGLWHRMGDVGYLDDRDRFWYCGRADHRVQTAAGTMYTIPCEAILNVHAAVGRSALVGVGPNGRQEPVMVVEPLPDSMPKGAAQRARLLAELHELGAASPLTKDVQHYLLCRRLPVDIRHNAKIFREQLAIWASKQIRRISLARRASEGH